MEPDDAYLGPDAELLDLIHKAFQAPPDEAPEAQEARRDRLVAVRRVTDLSAGDQQWLRDRIREVEEGKSATWQDPTSWSTGDWAAEDAAVERDDAAEGDWVGV